MGINWDLLGLGHGGSHYTILHLYFSLVKLPLKKNIASSSFPPWYFLNIQMVIVLSKQKHERASQQNGLKPTLAELSQRKSYT